VTSFEDFSVPNARGAQPAQKFGVKARKARAAARSVFCAVCERKTQKTSVFLHIPSIPFFAYTVNCYSRGQGSKMQAEIPACAACRGEEAQRKTPKHEALFCAYCRKIATESKMGKNACNLQTTVIVYKHRLLL
jgi:hypothetical protein